MPEPRDLWGAWHLRDFRITFDDGRAPLEPFGPGGTGRLVYGADGAVCAVLSRADRTPLEVPRLEAAHRATEAEKAGAFDGYLSYAGTWRLEGDEVVHTVTEALLPNLVGQEQRRTVTLDGDALTLAYRGGAKTYTLRWARTRAPSPDDLFAKHEARLDAAIRAARTRTAWTPFTESPSRKHHPEGAPERGKAAFEARLARPFDLTLPGETGRLGHEVSPYTGEPLGIDYPAVDPDVLLGAMKQVLPTWAETSPRERVGVCMEILDQLAGQVFENAWATFHTAGQGFMMAFAGSGANSLDRGLEGIAYAWKALSDLPESATFVRAFGHGPVRLEKRYRAVPRGLAAVITCASYPAWNALPALFANLATGNPVVLKPHPTCILPMAMVVQTARRVLEAHGHPPDVVTLLADTEEAPITKALVLHPDIAIVDFTGSQEFGRWIEENARHKRVYTETSGCNAVVLESVEALEPVLDALATSLCLFSAQMCTAAQNVFVPPFVQTADGPVSRADVTALLHARIDRITSDPARAAGFCATVQSPRTVASVLRLAESVDVVRAPAPYAHPEFPAARTLTPLLARAASSDTVYRREHFGPVGFVIACADADEALRRATEDAAQHGSIASYVYSTDPAFRERAEAAFWRAGASVGFDLVRQSPINFTAAFSDFHVTGLNPAGNASLTDLAFVADRFRIVQSKREIGVR
ncbi:MAG: phenylacetic acid degradation protein PaaN [Myxococcota bacterium]